jgi:hypothetical protein
MKFLLQFSIPMEIQGTNLSPSRLDNFPFPTGFKINGVQIQVHPNQKLCTIKRVKA